MNYQTFPNRLPGKPIAVLWVSGIFLALTLVGLFQALSLRHEVSYAQRPVVDLILWIGAAEFVLFLGATILLGSKITAVPLSVLSALFLALSLLSIGRVTTLSLLSGVVPMVVVLALLRSSDVRQFFSARRWYRQNTKQAARREPMVLTDV